MKPTNALYQSLLDAYSHFNRELFDTALPDVIFTVQRQKDLMGYFAPERWTSMDGTHCHEIAINPANMGRSRVIEVLQTLVHEMVHCWQYSFGSPGRVSYHNKEWAYKMIEVGLQPTDTGLEGGAIVGQCMSDYPISGGRFLQSCHTLMKSSGFSIPWIYRFTLPNPTVSQFETTSSGHSNLPKLDNVASESIELGNFDSGEMNESRINQYLYSSYRDILPKDTLIQLEPVVKSKAKYQCPKCKVNVWGKYGLNIQCGRCECAFISELN